MQRMLRRAGVEATRIRWTVPYRRVEILRYLGIDLLADVGANFGQYVGELRGSGWHGRVVSYEPTSNAYESLRRRVTGDAQWSCQRVAVGDTTGELTLHVSEESRFSSALPVLPETVARSASFRYASSEVVPVQRLDDLLSTESGASLAVKIDVQGFERQVLDGGPNTLNRLKFLEMEMTAHAVYEGQMLLMEAMQRATDAGLVLSLMENIYVDEATGRSLQFNGIFVRE